MYKDKTTLIEEQINLNKPSKLFNIINLFKYVFSSAKVICSIYLGLSILFSLTRPIVPFIWKHYIDTANTLSANQNAYELIFYVTVYYLLRIFENLIWRYTQAYEQIERLDVVQHNRFQELIDAKLYKKISDIPAEYHEVPKINDLIDRVFDFTGNQWGGLNRDVMLQGYFIIAKSIAVISVAVTLYIFNPWLTIMIIFAAIPTLYTTFVGEKISFKARNENADLSREAHYYQDLLLHNAPKEIKALDLFQFFFGKWKAKSDELYIKEKKIQMKQSLLFMLNDTITGLTNVSASIFAILLLTRGEISVGVLGGVMAMMAALNYDIHTLFKAIGTFISKKNEASQFFELMQFPEQQNTGESINTIDSIHAEAVSYRYPLTDKHVLKNINVTINKGEKVAFVGVNGAGKTTFVKMISGLLQPTDGHLNINSKGFDTLNPFKYYDCMSAVVQEPPKYTTMTIADNVLLADHTKIDQSVEAALGKAGFGDHHPETMLGKDIGGTDLSGGQWQKLAIARAHYRDRDFIILDEPTSNLDPLAETEIFNHYIEMSEDKTVIMVTHRISVASLADRIIVFEDGCIIEDGTHESLSHLGGEYARLYHAQAKWYDR